MENIVRLDEYRKQQRRPAPRMQAAPDAPRYFCLSCDGDHFKLYASGYVHCASCGSLIRNVEVSGTPGRG